MDNQTPKRNLRSAQKKKNEETSPFKRRNSKSVSSERDAKSSSSEDIYSKEKTITTPKRVNYSNEADKTRHENENTPKKKSANIRKQNSGLTSLTKNVKDLSLQSSTKSENNITVTPRSNRRAVKKNLTSNIDSSTRNNNEVFTSTIPTSERSMRIKPKVDYTEKLENDIYQPETSKSNGRKINQSEDVKNESKCHTDSEHLGRNYTQTNIPSHLGSLSLSLRPRRSERLGFTPQNNVHNLDKASAKDRKLKKKENSCSDTEESENQNPNLGKSPSKKTKIVTSPKTPYARKSKIFFNPSTPNRLSRITKANTPLQLARQRLHVSSVPKSLPCREQEFNRIFTFLHARLKDNSGGCIYISGVPGTGKTATVNEIIKCLKKLRDNESLEEFDLVEINGMKLSEPRQAYVQIYKQLSGQAKQWEEAQKLLHKKFTTQNNRKNMTLLIVDELDMLCTKRQDVIYNLLDWPSNSSAKLIVVTIANTMDLPERVMKGRVSSRLGLTRETFQPYNFRQLQEIAKSRLKDSKTFEESAVELVARKVAAVSGDARRALDIYRRSAEIAEENNKEIVTIPHVNQALSEMIASVKIRAIRNCSYYEQKFLKAMCSEVNRTGVEEIVFNRVYDQLISICSQEGDEVPNVSQALAICSRLSSWRLILSDHSRMDILQRLLLNVATDDVHIALSDISSC